MANYCICTISTEAQVLFYINQRLTCRWSMGSFLGITFVSNQNSTIFAASSLFPQSSILGLDHKQDILWGIPQGTTLQNWLWWGEECWCLLMKDLLPPLPTGRRAGQVLWSLLPVIHLPLKRWAVGWVTVYAPCATVNGGHHYCIKDCPFFLCSTW